MPNTPVSVANFYRVNHSKHAVKTVGIFGGGQLGLMLAKAALPLGLRCVFLEDAPDCPARLLGKVYSSEQFDDFAKACDVYTLEFENTPLALAKLIPSDALFPGVEALATAQDRLREKSLFNALNIATTPFVSVACRADLDKALGDIGAPLVLKTSRGGYDGKGQFVLKSKDDADAAWAALGDATKDAPLIAEGFIHFEKEVSIVACRAKNGDIRYYDLAQNTHHQGVLAKTVAPAVVGDEIAAQAQSAAKKILDRFSYVGTLAVEFFVTKQGLIANEIAPRVHNSGHWSIEGAVCSQFENHMRAVAGLPLGDTRLVEPCVMLNVVGQYPDPSAALAIKGAHLHLYDKAERDGRKIGHITLSGKNATELKNATAQAIEILPNRLGLV